MKRLSFIVLLLCLLSVGSTSLAQDEPIEITPALQDVIDDIETRVENLRELTLTDEIQRLFPTQEEAAAFFEDVYNEELTDEILLQTTQFYRAFDFVGPEFDYKATIIELISTQAAGFYNTETNEMNVLFISGEPSETDFPLLEKMIYAHEYTHAIQDQYFNSEGLLADLGDESDLAIAVLALIEGDAMLVMQEYLLQLAQENPVAMIAAMGDILALQSSGFADIPEGTPPIMEAELTMPYLDGMAFVMKLHQTGGWEAVNAAFEQLPASSEHILHPETYLNGDMPHEVTLQPALSVFDEDWSMLVEGRIGEFYLREYLKTQLGIRAAGNAAAGWGGDAYQLYYNAVADERAWIARFSWDTLDEQAEFTQAFREFARRRSASEPPGEEVQCWQAEVDVLCQALAGDDNLIAYAPSDALARALIDSQR